MSSHSIPFSAHEYQRRLAKTRAAMVQKNIDVLFIEDPSNMSWLTGYDGWSFYVHQGVLVFHDEAPIWWGRRQDSNGALRTVWMEPERVMYYDDHYVQSEERHPMQVLARILENKGYAQKSIGVELENYYFSAKAFLTMQASLPKANLVDATALVNWQRCIKSEEELVFMRKAARITEKIIGGAVERIEPGLNKNALVAEIYRDAVMGVGEDWGDYASIVPLLPSGSDAAAPHLTWDGREFVKGEATFFELSGCYRRYHVPLSRTVYLGQPPSQIVKAEKALVEGLEAGIEVARSGNTAGDISRALAAPLERAGIERGARCGYSIGLSYPPDWGERTVSLRDEDTTELQPGMTFHFMPGLWMKDWGLEITESILIAETGAAECFCDLPRRLMIKE